MVIDDLASNTAVCQELGRRLKDARISLSLTQVQLAARAGVSPKTISNLEGGSDVALGSLISVLRALSLLSRMDLLVPQEEIHPRDMVANRVKRQRVRPTRKEKDASSWKWGDES